MNLARTVRGFEFLLSRCSWTRRSRELTTAAIEALFVDPAHTGTSHADLRFSGRRAKLNALAEQPCRTNDGGQACTYRGV